MAWFWDVSHVMPSESHVALVCFTCDAFRGAKKYKHPRQSPVLNMTCSYLSPYNISADSRIFVHIKVKLSNNFTFKFTDISWCFKSAWPISWLMKRWSTHCIYSVIGMPLVQWIFQPVLLHFQWPGWNSSRFLQTTATGGCQLHNTSLSSHYFLFNAAFSHLRRKLKSQTNYKAHSKHELCFWFSFAGR